jgi:FkbM family methyltransferase
MLSSLAVFWWKNKVTKFSRHVAHLLVRCASRLSGLRHVPILGGILSWTSRRLVPPGTLIWVQIQHGPAQGLWIRVNPRTGQDVLQGTSESAVQQAIQEHLRPGMTFYDLGANIGFFSLLAARLVGPSGRVVSFEADPEIAARLAENLSYNNFTHVAVEEKAVWSEHGTVSFARVDSNTSPDRGLGHVSVGERPAADAISVEAISLDQYVLSHPLPDFLKCDVEGAEVPVFQGAERLLKEKRPVLLVEMHSKENRAALLMKFNQCSYTCINLDENHVLALPR